MRKLLLLLVVFCSQHIALADDRPLTVRVTEVVDGDTFKIETTVRVEALDCPEKAQSGGLDAQTKLQQMIEGKRIALRITKRDVYGRFLAQAFDTDDNDIAATMVEEGRCWVYKTVKDKDLLRLQQEAREEKVGIWAAKPEAPWEWRKRNKDGKKLQGKLP